MKDQEGSNFSSNVFITSVRSGSREIAIKDLRNNIYENISLRQIVVLSANVAGRLFVTGT